MKKDIKYKIGEISKMYGISVRMLRHYEQIKLLMPKTVDDFTRYRYYGSEEITRLFYINSLRNKGFTLTEIRDMFEEGIFIPDTTRLQCKIQEYEERIKLLKERLNFMKDVLFKQMNRNKTDDIYLDKLPSIIVASHTATFYNYNDFFKYIHAEVRPEMICQKCCFPDPNYHFIREISRDMETGEVNLEFCDEVLEMKEDSDTIRFKRLPEVPLAICMKVYGTYEKLHEKQAELFLEITKRGYRIVGDARFNLVYTGWSIRNPEKWLTVIQVPVEEA